MKASGLGDVVRGLLLREVGNVAGHGRRDDEAPGATLLEVMADGLGAVEGSGEIGLDDFVPVLDAAVKDAGVGGSAGVGDEGVNLAKVLDDVLDELVDALVGADITLVGLRLDAILLGELFGVLLTSLGAGSVGDSNIGTHLGTTTGSFNAHAPRTRGTGDDDDLALEAEEVHEVRGLGNFDRHDDGWWKGIDRRVNGDVDVESDVLKCTGSKRSRKMEERREEERGSCTVEAQT